MTGLFEDLPSGGAPAPVALARKWRPRSFATVVGQDHVVKALQHALGQNRLHHAYLLTGSRGVGKTTLARIFAKALNCETGLVAEPCGQCSSCREIDAGRFVDYIEIDAASNRGVAEIQQLLEQSRFAPTSGRFKVYVIDEVHMLSGHAFNAMLKTLEEPPAQVKFILATTDPQKIPVTVLSRCLQFGLKNLRLEALQGHIDFVLAQEAVVAEAPAVQALARAAKGSVRDALSLTDQAIAYGGGVISLEAVSQMLGLVQREALLATAEYLARGQAAEAIEAGEALLQSGALAESVLESLARLYHEAALVSALGLNDAVSDAGVEALAQALGPERAQLGYQILVLGRRDLSLAPDEATGLQMTFLRLLAFRPESPASGGGSGGSPRPAVKAAALAAAPAVKPIPVVAPKADLSALTPDRWPQISRELGLAGLSRQFAQQSTFEGRQGEAADRLAFCVPLEALAETSLVERVEASLRQYFGQKLSLVVRVGTPEGPTAAAQDAHKKAEALADAEASIAQSPVVQDLIRTFDAKIVPGSIRAVDSPAPPSSPLGETS
ncbi:MAG: hypothetical protein RLZZ344_939 [Pseudomonadota bacterium]|jgi:DNA polymerase-3 subunit gamma/tau